MSEIPGLFVVDVRCYVLKRFFLVFWILNPVSRKQIEDLGFLSFVHIQSCQTTNVKKIYILSSENCTKLTSETCLPVGSTRKKKCASFSRVRFKNECIDKN